MDIPEPSPAEGEVIVRVSAVGICGSELEGYLGYSSIRKPPLVMGHEFSAFVTHDGSRERRFPVGTLVTVNPLMTCRRCRACKRGATNLCIHRKLIGVSRQGGMAEYVAVPEENVHVLPEGVSALQGSLSEPLAVAVRAVELSRFALLDRVAIIGAGSIGLLTLQVIRSLGPADIAVIDIADERLATASALGATTTLNTKPRQSEPKDFVEHEHSYDIVLECVGRDETRALASRLAAPGGRIVLVGLHDQHSSMDFNAIVRHELQVLGSYVYSDANFSTAIEFLRLGRIATEPWIIERPLQEGPRSFQELTTGAGMNHKVVLLPKS
ncbi:MAG: alcohol dehydrogenase catalytic domain-containing protein [Acidobacteriota bacterium]|nr:alcohol dehydrogenase catalytic domain-containing protein [Acidobacteriota bacterium]